MDYKCLQTLLIHSLNSFRLRESYKLKRSYLLRAHDFVLNEEGMRGVMEKSKIFKFSKNASYFINFFFIFFHFSQQKLPQKPLSGKPKRLLKPTNRLPTKPPLYQKRRPKWMRPQMVQKLKSLPKHHST